MLLTERRRTRSCRPSEALSLLLQHAREKIGVPAIALGTPSGFLIAGAGDNLERLAELGADVEGGVASIAHIATRRLRVGESDLLLTSVGGKIDIDLSATVRRILAD
jgi:hypothetical protein